MCDLILEQMTRQTVPKVSKPPQVGEGTEVNHRGGSCLIHCSVRQTEKIIYGAFSVHANAVPRIAQDGVAFYQTASDVIISPAVIAPIGTPSSQRIPTRDGFHRG